MKNQEEVKKIILKLPDTPGVYLFKSKRRKLKGESEILYIGKATSLKDRVKSYFRKDIVETRSPLISKMLSQFDDIEFIKTDSVLEALVLEAHLIKKYQPEANIKEKDNKSFNFVVITKEDFPRVLVLRGRELLSSHFMRKQPPKASSHTTIARQAGYSGSHTTIAQSSTGYRMTKLYDTRLDSRSLVDARRVSYSFGPFPNGSQLKEALKIIRKMFPYRDRCVPFSELKQGQKPKPCFNRQIGLCPGVCTGEIRQAEYAERIKNIILFFEGNKKRLLNNLAKQMQSFAKHHEFEKANGIKRTLFTLSHIQDISLIKEDTVSSDTFRIESYDIAHMSGQNVVGVMTVVEDGEVKKSDYRKFKIHEPGLPAQAGVNDTKALSEILSRRLAHIEWKLPDLIVVDGGFAQKRVMEKILQKNNQKIPVVSVVKDERHRPREILGDKKWLKYEREIILSNFEAHRFAIGFHKKLRDRL